MATLPLLLCTMGTAQVAVADESADFASISAVSAVDAAASAGATADEVRRGVKRDDAGGDGGDAAEAGRAAAEKQNPADARNDPGADGKDAPQAGAPQRGRTDRARVSSRTPTPSRRSSGYRRWYQPTGGRTVVYGGSWWGGAYGGVGDIYRGMAAIIDARANLLRAQSEALINIEEARSRYIDNRVKWARFYLDWRRMGEQRRKDYWAEKRAARDRYLAMIRQREPERLTPSQLDPVTGHINWPVILTDPRFAKPRKKLEELFALRAYAGPTPDFSRQVRKYVDQMRSELLAMIRDLPANEYMHARRFLDLLARETFYLTTQ
ncbi:MAG: hypothetical protein D6725_03690 [Planctomycetota bacterium]|nr:MAG: hypothetical protein D6725_03690 [Planctomycetota bacterium]